MSDRVLWICLAVDLVFFVLCFVSPWFLIPLLVFGFEVYWLRLDTTIERSLPKDDK